MAPTRAVPGMCILARQILAELLISNKLIISNNSQTLASTLHKTIHIKVFQQLIVAILELSDTQGQAKNSYVN